MKIIVDNKIPYIQDTLSRLADEVIYLPGNAFTAETIKDADALIIRTRTRCNRDLLENSKVKFIASATIGYDHIDTFYCSEKGIYWTNAPGCNAASVTQYLHSILLLLNLKKEVNLSQACLGIIGVGNVGKKVKILAESLGMKVLLNDPPRQNKGEKGFVGLDIIKKECDIITFHVPLNRQLHYNTFHLADSSFFESLQKKPIVINTSRGEVIDTCALLNAIEQGKIKEAVIDVWENEPAISLTLLKKVFIGTPHIAGYSADGKANATRMVLQSLCNFFNLPSKINIVLPAPTEPFIKAATEAEAYLQIYNPENDCRALREHPENFEWLRGNYPFRREASAYKIQIER